MERLPLLYIDNKPISLIMNASGAHCKTKEQMDHLINNGMKTIITKTCTLKSNIGNPLPNFAEPANNISINCLGMPNLGYYYYRDLYLEYSKKCITYIISIDASNWDELKEILIDYNLFISHHTTCRELVEINISCPNIINHDKLYSKRLIGYDTLSLSRLLENIKSLDLQFLNIGLKLPPYIDNTLLHDIANIIIQYSAIVKYIVCSNSIPNGMIIDINNKKPYLSIETGGISGCTNKLIGISNVFQFRQIFTCDTKNNNIFIIGCGGIENLNDILEYLIAGANCIQIGRILYIHGMEKIIEIYKEINNELFMNSKNNKNNLDIFITLMNKFNNNSFNSKL